MVFFLFFLEALADAPCFGGGTWCPNGFVESEIESRNRDKSLGQDDDINDMSTAVETMKRSNRKSAKKSLLLDDTMDEALVTDSSVSKHTPNVSSGAEEATSLQKEIKISMGKIGHAKTKIQTSQKDSGETLPLFAVVEREEQVNSSPPCAFGLAEPFTKSLSFDRSVRSAGSKFSETISLQSSASSGFGPVRELMAYRNQVESKLMSAQGSQTANDGSSE